MWPVGFGTGIPRAATAAAAAAVPAAAVWRRRVLHGRHEVGRCRGM
jgi:hypothetical protein